MEMGRLANASLVERVNGLLARISLYVELRNHVIPEALIKTSKLIRESKILPW